ncbi:rho GDP-dissociation inhibitor [Aspergillus alliaceus]|uniref:rho GDP-dissociation inhibitor n=1 Tax=Petromyces alliaceus TaxID=209559 RepID=UPI0012A3F0E9|nr:E set domain-containing protein [Aspergillus alliaceus]KAB8232997.1 E set domain-containing protein [Aspergillus alliaceus]
MPDHDEDLVASKTEGFKVGEKKSINEYAELDKNDESLNRWKASLGLNTGTPIGDPSDPRKCIIKSLALEVDGRPDVVIDLSASDALTTLKDKPFTIKEGATYCVKVNFQVHHEVLSGLKYLQVVKRKGLRVSKDEEMLGSYAPNTTDKPMYEKKFNAEEAPSGIIARGHYNAVSKFIDDDDHTHLQFEWSFDIAKDW